jgi:hypothetical protein
MKSTGKLEKASGLVEKGETGGTQGGFPAPFGDLQALTMLKNKLTLLFQIN